jgi:hypothetical protein
MASPRVRAASASQACHAEGPANNWRTNGEAVPKLVRIWYEAGTATTRRNGEGNPKPTRSAPEAHPKRTRRRPEAHPKKMHSNLGMDSTNFHKQGKLGCGKGMKLWPVTGYFLKKLIGPCAFKMLQKILPITKIARYFIYQYDLTARFFTSHQSGLMINDTIVTLCHRFNMKPQQKVRASLKNEVK